MKDPSRLQFLKDALARLRDEDRPPERLVQAAIGLRGRESFVEIFRLRAAASPSLAGGFSCISQSGMLRLDFLAERNSGNPPQRGQILLCVLVDREGTFEKSAAKIFISTESGERLLAESIVRDSKLLANIEMTDVDLTRIDAIRIVFCPPSAK